MAKGNFSGLTCIKEHLDVTYRKNKKETKDKYAAVLYNINTGQRERLQRQSSRVWWGNDPVHRRLLELPATRSIHEGLDFEIVNKMESNPKITRTELASDLGVAESTISNHISSLIADGYIAREGSKKTGVWVILRK